MFVLNYNSNKKMSEIFIYGEKEIKSLDLAYCATVHKMQGSSAENVIMLLDYSAYTMLSKQLLYVGITRAELKFTLLAEASALHRAISTDASESRNTFLPRFIKMVIPATI